MSEDRQVTMGLTRGLCTTIDLSTFVWASGFSWYALSNGSGKFYAARDKVIDGKKKTILLHREILNLGTGCLDGEHKDGDSLNNLASNLRPATRTQNHANRIRLPDHKHSKFRGVSVNHTGKAWTAQISINNKKKHLGSFLSESAAARAYDAAATAQFGEFARLNFP